MGMGENNPGFPAGRNGHGHGGRSGAPGPADAVQRSPNDAHAKESCASGGPPSRLHVPKDFTLVPELLPEWIDIPGVCKEAKRFVALHTLSSFNALAINDGRRVFTADDRGGEFRRLFTRALSTANNIAAGKPNGRRVLSDSEAALVYDCEKGEQWVAPRPASIQFLSLQF